MDIFFSVHQTAKHQKGLPHLTLQKPNPLENAITGPGDCDLVGPTWIIVCPIDEIIPNLSISIQRPVTVAVPSHIIPSKEPGRALVLVSDR
jgi:hypothetical protein